MTNNVLVLGATGTVGCPLVAKLASQGVTVRGATRDPNRAAQMVGSAAEWIEFDLQRPESFAAALRGIDRVFMISRPGDDDADQLAAPFVDALRASGVQHVVNLSAMGTEQRPEFSLRKVELQIEASGIPHTHLRPNFFMQIHATGALCQAIRTTRRIALPAADAKLSFIDARDVAEVATRVLTDVRSNVNHAYTLTGPAAINYDQVAASLTAAVGQDVQYLPIDEAAARDMLLAAGFPDAHIARLLEMYRLVRLGACEPISPDTAALLGRPPICFADFAADYATCWK